MSLEEDNSLPPPPKSRGSKSKKTNKVLAEEILDDINTNNNNAPTLASNNNIIEDENPVRTLTSFVPNDFDNNNNNMITDDQIQQQPLPSQTQSPKLMSLQANESSNIKSKFKNAGTELLKFIQNWDLKSAIEILTMETPVNVNVRDSDGMTPLILLIKGAVDGNISSEESASEFITAISKIINRTEIDMNSFDNDGLTPLLWAIKENSLNIFQILLKHPKADINFMAEESCTALWMIIRDGNVEMLEEILESRRVLDMSKSNGSLIHSINSFTCEQILNHKIENLSLMSKSSSKNQSAKAELEKYIKIKQMIAEASRPSSAPKSASSSRSSSPGSPTTTATLDPFRFKPQQTTKPKPVSKNGGKSRRIEKSSTDKVKRRLFMPLDPKKSSLSEKELLRRYFKEKRELVASLNSGDITIDQFKKLSRRTANAIIPIDDPEPEKKFSSPGNAAAEAAKARLEKLKQKNMTRKTAKHF